MDFGQPEALATSANLFELDEFFAPITIKASHSDEIAFTAVCRLVVA